MNSPSGMWRFFPSIGAFSGALAVLAGAFGAHALKGHVSAEHLSAWETAAAYHLVHSLALFAAARPFKSKPAFAHILPCYCFLLGILLFSGSLYALVATGEKWLGPITPIGGLLLVGGWVTLGWSYFRSIPDSRA